MLVVFCHPSKNSFTNTVKEAFINGLEAAGHSYEVSDLYADKFNPIMSEEEYIREGFYQLDKPIKDDVLREQLEAMKTVMVGDRVRNRAKKCEVYVFDEMTSGYGNDENREKRITDFSQKAYDLAQQI